MELSVIIVNYNVKHFLEQCLYSVREALRQTSGEIIVIDNCSTDNSLTYLQPLFPEVQFIANKENLGFARACNQGLAISKGRFVLFLNPDTIVPEDSFESAIRFMDEHPEAGALGSKMLDGSGSFLKESKRAFPSPLTSLYKLFGLSKLFPHSAVFSRYHLGHLDENKNNEVDVLAGAYMFIRKKVLDEVGGFDEQFFMYGEDVDLSYRIQKSGRKNYYFANSPIIHFKGESTRKGSMNYVRMFYSAMSLFVRKHYGGSRAGIFNSLIHFAIWFRAGLSAIGQFIRRLGLPLIDAGLIILSFWLMTKIWPQYVRPDIKYDNRLLWMAIPGFTLFYLVTAYYAGLYDKWYRWSGLIRSTTVATISLLAAYSLLPEQYRFSRAIVLFGAILAFILISLLRYLLISTRVISSEKQKEEHTKYVVAGTVAEYNEVMQLLEKAGFRQQVLGRVAVEKNDQQAIGHISRLAVLAASLPFREVICCQGTLGFGEIIEIIRQLPPQLTALIHAAGSYSVVGSESKDSSGEALSLENSFPLADPYQLRLKRGTDVLVAIGGLIAFPVLLFFVKKPIGFLTNLFRVLTARRTWIGYAGSPEGLPQIRKGILGCNGIPPHLSAQLSPESLHRADYWYARDYTAAADLKVILRFYRNLGG